MGENQGLRRRLPLRLSSMARGALALLVAGWMAVLVPVLSPVRAQDALPPRTPPTPDRMAPATAAARAFDRLVGHFLDGMKWADSRRLPADFVMRVDSPIDPERIAWLEQMAAAFAAIDAGELDTSRFIDHRLASSFIAGELDEFYSERPDRHDATAYLPRLGHVSGWIGRRTQRDDLTHALHRFAQFPGLVAPAFSRLDAPFADRTTAAHEWFANLDTFIADSWLPKALHLLGHSDAFRDYRRRVREIRAELDGYRLFLAGHLGAVERSDAEQQMARRRAYERMLKYEHHLSESPEEILALGRRMVAQIQQELANAAYTIGPRSWREIVTEMQDKHPAPDAVQGVIRGHIADLKAWMNAEPIMPMPPRAFDFTLAIERPENPYSPFAYYNPLGRDPGRYVAVLPHPGLDAVEAEARMRDHFSEQLRVVAAHEVLPGHHLQFAVADTAKLSPLRRRLGMVMTYVEGWGLYCERLIDECGLLRNARERIAMLKMQLWRAARIIIDVSVHCFGMTEDEGVKLLSEGVMISPDNARFEVRRYVRMPGQPMSYMVGMTKFFEMRREAKRRFGPRFSLLDFHDRVLRTGPAPLRLLWAQVLGDRLPALTPLSLGRAEFPRAWLTAPPPENWRTQSPALGTPLPGCPGENLGVGELIANRHSGDVVAVRFAVGTRLRAGTALGIFDETGKPISIVRVGAEITADADRARFADFSAELVGYRVPMISGLRVAVGDRLPRRFELAASDPLGVGIVVAERVGDGNPRAILEVPAVSASRIPPDGPRPMRDANGRLVGWFTPISRLDAPGTEVVWVVGEVTAAVTSRALPAPLVGLSVDLAPLPVPSPLLGNLVAVTPADSTAARGVVALGLAQLPGDARAAVPQAFRPGAEWRIVAADGAMVGRFRLTLTVEAPANAEQISVAGEILATDARAARVGNRLEFVMGETPSDGR